MLFQLWENELADCITLLAPRAGGKSHFLQHDLVPWLEKQGWRTQYFSCAQVPSKFLELRLRETLTDFAMNEHWLSHQLQSLLRKNPAKESASPIAALFAQLHSQKKPVALLIDDADLLLQKERGMVLLEEIFHAMPPHGQFIKIIFACQQRHHAAYPSLLAQHSACLTLPEMGAGYLDHLLNLYKQLTQNIGKSSAMSDNYAGITWGQIDRASIMPAFEKLQRSPAAMRAMIEELVLDPVKSLPEVLERQLQRQQQVSIAALGWEDLARLDRLLLLGIAEGRQQFYELKYRLWLAEQTGSTAISASQIQSSFKKMQRNRVIAQLANQWQIIDPQLSKLLRRNHE